MLLCGEELVWLIVQMNKVSRTPTTGAEVLTLRTAKCSPSMNLLQFYCRNCLRVTVTSVDDFCRFSKFASTKNIVRLGQVSRTSSLQFGSWDFDELLSSPITDKMVVLLLIYQASFTAAILMWSCTSFGFCSIRLVRSCLPPIYIKLYGKRAFSSYAPAIWNVLPVSVF